MGYFYVDIDELDSENLFKDNFDEVNKKFVIIINKLRLDLRILLNDDEIENKLYDKITEIYDTYSENTMNVLNKYNIKISLLLLEKKIIRDLENHELIQQLELKKKEFIRFEDLYDKYNSLCMKLEKEISESVKTIIDNNEQKKYFYKE